MPPVVTNAANGPRNSVFSYIVWECPVCRWQGPDISTTGRTCPSCERAGEPPVRLVKSHQLEMLPVIS